MLFLSILVTPPVPRDDVYSTCTPYVPSLKRPTEGVRVTVVSVVLMVESQCFEFWSPTILRNPFPMLRPVPPVTSKLRTLILLVGSTRWAVILAEKSWESKTTLISWVVDADMVPPE